MEELSVAMIWMGEPSTASTESSIVLAAFAKPPPQLPLVAATSWAALVVGEGAIELSTDLRVVRRLMVPPRVRLGAADVRRAEDRRAVCANRNRLRELVPFGKPAISLSFLVLSAISSALTFSSYRRRDVQGISRMHVRARA